jgi:hypothetical protein
VDPLPTFTPLEWRLIADACRQVAGKERERPPVPASLDRRTFRGHVNSAQELRAREGGKSRAPSHRAAGWRDSRHRLSNASGSVMATLGEEASTMVPGRIFMGLERAVALSGCLDQVESWIR